MRTATAILMFLLMAGVTAADHKAMFPYSPGVILQDQQPQQVVVVVQTVVVIQTMPVMDRPIPIHEFHRMACARSPAFPQRNLMPPVEQYSLNYNLHMGGAPAIFP
jgi:hypothetical protein